MGLSRVYKCASIDNNHDTVNIRFYNDKIEAVFVVYSGDEKPFVVGKSYSIVVMNDKGVDE